MVQVGLPGQSFMDALEDFAGREETIKMKGYKSKERKALHEKILRDLNEEQGGKFEAGKTIEIVLGPPGAGKSSVLVKRLQKELGAIVIDSDMVKEKLPEFADGLGANAVHEESKAISGRWLDEAVASDWNIIHPIVGANPAKVNDLVDEMLTKCSAAVCAAAASPIVPSYRRYNFSYSLSRSRAWASVRKPFIAWALMQLLKLMTTYTSLVPLKYSYHALNFLRNRQDAPGFRHPASRAYQDFVLKYR